MTLFTDCFMIDLFEIRLHLSVLFLSWLFMLQWLPNNTADAAGYHFKSAVYSWTKSYESNSFYMKQIALSPKYNPFCK